MADIGIAAVHIGGMTVHSFSGVGKGEDGVIKLKESVTRTRRTKKNWKDCKVLVIDEVSMVRIYQIFVVKLNVAIGRFVR
jgi:ATP-dependent DNA helicase PIF1